MVLQCLFSPRTLRLLHGSQLEASLFIVLPSVELVRLAGGCPPSPLSLSLELVGLVEPARPSGILDVDAMIVSYMSPCPACRDVGRKQTPSFRAFFYRTGLPAWSGEHLFCVWQPGPTDTKQATRW